MAPKKVMLIDDSDICLETAAEDLVQAGYEVRTCLYPSPTSQSLTSVLVEFHPDIIVCDVDMPYLKGDAIAQIIKASPLYKTLKVCFHSSKPAEELAALVQSTHADGFVNKSADSRALLAKVRELVGS